MTQYVTAAGITWRVLLPEGNPPLGSGQLAGFEVPEPENWDHTLRCAIADPLPAPQGELVFREPGKQVYVSGDTCQRYTGPVERELSLANLCVIRRGAESLALLRPERQPGVITDRVVLNALEAEHHIVRRGGFLLHASWIRWRGRAILFTAPSQTGKSTQAELWRRHRGAQLINGDRAAVFAGEIPQVRGIPFSGSSGVGRNEQMPLAALVYLSQAPENTLTPLKGYRAFRRIWEGCCVNLWDREDTELCAEHISRVLDRIPVFHLACRPDEGAVVALEERLEELWQE